MIQEGLGPPWPEPIREALEPFRQGHLIERPPLFWAADLCYSIYKTTAAVADTVPEQERGEDFVEVAEDDRPPYGIITSQSCDLAEERSDPQKPWISVAPVYALAAEDPLLGRDFIFALDLSAPGDQVWVADLRIEVPLEKSLLVGREPIEAFAAEPRAVAFGRWLAMRRGRPALASVVHEIIGATIDEIRRESNSQRKIARRARPNVYRLMLAIEEGERMDPHAIKLYIVTDGQASEDARSLFDELWWSRARLVAAQKGLQLHPNGWLNAREADLTLLDDLIELRTPF
ncbi:MAG TPA: hypothetical protein VGV40_03810 [Solirubrobacteraceae bacterium]|nr:hypothetical protein [Solirubrobacteraceae bacterium]